MLLVRDGRFWKQNEEKGGNLEAGDEGAVTATWTFLYVKKTKASEGKRKE